jgi:hypothetical protein
MYCKYDNETKKCLEVGTGTNTEFYKSIGMEDLEVEKAYDGSYYLKGYAPTKPLEEFKKEKLQELSQKSSAFEQTENKEMYIISSLGYKVNADPKALRNINVLISQKVTQFKVYDNTIKSVTVEDLKIIKSEIEQNALNLYHQKWTFEDLINKAETKEELDAIEIKFEMLDFS